MTIIIDHERYGVWSEFRNVTEAEAAIRKCGPEFEKTALHYSGNDITDETGEIIGRIEQ